MSTEKTTEPSTTKIVISFIVPAYNEEAELPGTLRAIRSAADGYEHEIVLVNDGSTDATGAIGEEFGARVISIQRRQIAAARNAGRAAAGGFDEIYFASEEIFFTIALKRLGQFRLLCEPAMTSGRKLRMYSGWKIFTRSLSLIFGGPRGVMSRKKLDMWYGGDREKRIG